MRLSESDWKYLDERTTGFTGREWVFGQVRSFLAAGEGTLLLVGPPGSGKTAVAARLAQASAGRGDTAVPGVAIREGTFDAAVFCRSGRVDLLDIAQSISAQAAEALPEFRQAQESALAQQVNVDDVMVQTGDVADGAEVTGVRIALDDLGPERAFSSGVALPLMRLADSGPARVVVLLVDALDEALATPSGRDFPRLLGELVGVKIVATARDDPRVIAQLGERVACVHLVDDAPAEADDVLRYAIDRLRGRGPQAGMRALASRIALEAEGNFLSCAYVIEALIDSGVLTDVDEAGAAQLGLPGGGLPGVYRDFLRRELAREESAWSERFRPILAPIAVALGDGLTISQLAAAGSRLAGRQVSRSSAADVTRIAAQFLDGPRPHGPFRVYHQSFADFLCDADQNPDWHIDADEAHHAIADALIEDVPKDESTGRRNWQAADAYALSQLASHAAVAGVLDGLLLDHGFLLAARMPTLLGVLSRAGSEKARRAAHAYQRGAHHLATADEDERAAQLAFAALKVGSIASATEFDDMLASGWWAPRWARWRPSPPHRIVARRQDVVVDVALVGGSERPVLISCTRDDVQAWDLRASREVRLPVTPPEGEITAMTVASQGGRTIVIVGTDRGRLHSFDLPSGTSLHDFGPPAGAAITAIAAGRLRDEHVIVSGDTAGMVHVLGLSDGYEVVPAFKAYVGRVESIVLGRLDDRDVLLTSTDPIDVPTSERRLVHVLDPLAGEVVSQSPPGEGGLIAKCVALAEVDDEHLAVGGCADGALRAWSLPAMRLIEHTSRGPDWVMAVAVGAVDGETLAFAAIGDAIRAYELPDLRERGDPWQGHDEGVRALAVGSLLDRPFLASGAVDRSVRVWDVREALSAEQTPVGHEGAVNGLASGRFSDRDAVLSVGADNSLRVWDLHTGAALREPLRADGLGLKAVAFACVDGRPVAIAGSQTGVVRAWDLASGEATWIEQDPGRGANAITDMAIYETDGETVLVYAGGSTIRRRRARDGHELEPSFDDPWDKTIWAVAVAELGGQAVVLWGGGSEALHTWDLQRAKRAQERWVHREWVTSVVAIQAGAELLAVTGCDDGKVRTRNLADPRSPVQVLDAGRHAAKAVVVVETASGQVIAAGGRSGVLHLWRTDGTPAGHIELGSGITALLAPAPTLILAATYAGIAALRLELPGSEDREARAARSV